LKKLQSDNRFIIQASSSAQKATDYILDLKPPVDKEASEQQGTPADDCPL
jgi:antirestriction protein ArdC